MFIFIVVTIPSHVLSNSTFLSEKVDQTWCKLFIEEYYSFMFGQMRKHPNYVGPVALLSADDDTELDIDGVT